MRRNAVPAFCSVALLLTVGACASSSTTRTTSSSSDTVTSIEIDATAASSAYDLVNRLRPNWLRAPVTGSIGGGRATSQVILVYLDDTRLGGVDALRTLSASVVRSMRFLDAARAGTILRDIGSEPIGAAIVLSTKK